jgi:hypothetical protein
MITLSESQTNLIIQWVKSQHLTIQSLENEFVDHICCDVEELMNQGKSFKHAFETLKKNLGDDILTGLEKQTILQLTYNQRIMKSMTRLAGIIVLLSFFAAILSRIWEIEYWKNLMAGGMLILGLFFAPLFFINHYQQQDVRGQKVLHIFGFLAAFLVPLSAFLGLLNSQYAMAVMGVGILFLVLGFIPLSWLSVSKGSGRSVITGSILFLMFFVMISYGFFGVRISKDRVENWIFLSHSSEKSSEEMQKLNSACIMEMKYDSGLFELASEIGVKSDNLIRKMKLLREDFLLGVSPGYKEGDLFFNGMDNHFSGKRLLIENTKTDQVLKETGEYEAWLISVLSEENEIAKQKISNLLNVGVSGHNQSFDAKKNYLFRDFPAIADISVINCLIINVMVAENQALKFLGGKKLVKS